MLKPKVSVHGATRQILHPFRFEVEGNPRLRLVDPRICACSRKLWQGGMNGAKIAHPMSLCGRTEISSLKSGCFLSSYSKWRACAEGPCVRLDPELNRKELCRWDRGELLKKHIIPSRWQGNVIFWTYICKRRKGLIDIQYERGKQELLVQAAEREENYEESVTETLRHSITNSFFGMWGSCDFEPHATATTVLMQSFQLLIPRFKTMCQCVFYHVRYPFQVSTVARYIWCTWLRLVRYLTMARTKVKDSLIDGPLDCQGVQWVQGTVKWIEMGFQIGSVFWKRNMSLSMWGLWCCLKSAINDLDPAQVSSYMRMPRLSAWSSSQMSSVKEYDMHMCSGECIGQDWIDRLMCLWLNAAPTKGEMEEFISGTNTVPRLQWNLNLSVLARGGEILDIWKSSSWRSDQSDQRVTRVTVKWTSLVWSKTS